ncbi:hypothetical protein GWK08_04880 [Leptobacterium flavescens]|uniref:Uncharacterized protein n=1 Tax=Leptobacterium flavescens TaxID=472055 RepID=A0A6P0UJN3_9FLAO|nr:hypothetical protein [Leptobacterium flavescens]NER12762.1 hypothetical protein [Leptobacterium flavescens]
MKWTGNKYKREIVTEEGYCLKVKLTEESKYWWGVYKNKEVIYEAKKDRDLKGNLSAAQKAAQQRMIRHMNKEA